MEDVEAATEADGATADFHPNTAEPMEIAPTPNVR